MQSMPKQPPPAPKYLTKVPSRGYSGLWKFHSNLGHAKNALQNGYGRRHDQTMELYEWTLIHTDEDHLEMGWLLLYTWNYGEKIPWA